MKQSKIGGLTGLLIAAMVFTGCGSDNNDVARTGGTGTTTGETSGTTSTTTGGTSGSTSATTTGTSGTTSTTTGTSGTGGTGGTSGTGGPANPTLAFSATAEPALVNDALLSSAYGNGKFVFVGSGDETTSGRAAIIATSSDGVTLTVATSVAQTTGLTDVTYGNGEFLAVTDGGATETSPDGVNWTAGAALPLAVTGYKLAFGNGVFVAVTNAITNGSTISTSTNGVNWNTQAATISTNNITFGGGEFVVVGTNASGSAAAETSSDGTTFVTPTLPAGFPLNSVAYALNSQFGAEYVASSIQGQNFYGSSDLTNWGQFSLVPSLGFAPVGICAGNGLFLSWGYGTATSNPNTSANLALSNNGDNWSAQTVQDITAGNQNVVAQFKTGVYGNGRFVLTDVRNNLYTASF